MESTSNKTSQYQPLVSIGNNHPIRLLILLPAPELNAEIRCELLYTSLEAQTEFEALSYTWGDAKDVVPILLHEEPYNITRSLDSALRHLRYKHVIRVLWVDALCINQVDIPERNLQVAHMRKIYNVGGAWQVLVWLGEAGSARTALRFCKRLSEEGSEFALLPGYELEWEACRELFARPWWSRAWIIQEVVHTNEVVVHIGGLKPISIEEICGLFHTYTYRLHVRNILKVVLQERDSIGLQQKMVPKERDWNSWIRSQNHLMETALEIHKLRLEAKNPPLDDMADYPPSLPGLIMRFRNHKTTDFRDKIYAFLGLALHLPMIDEIPVDYSLSKRIFYTIVARALIMRSLIPLLLVESYDRPVGINQELPSWVTDYTIKQGLVPRAYVSTAAYFHADRGFPLVAVEPRFLSLRSSGVLLLRGIYIAVLTGVYKTRMTQDEDIQEVDGLKLVQYDERLQMRRRDFIKYPLPEWPTRDVETGLPFITHSNTSWGPIFCEIGDIIIIAAGSRIPLVLREIELGKYLFVGACWMINAEIQIVHFIDENSGFSKIMYGSVCEGLPDDYEAEVFHIY